MHSRILNNFLNKNRVLSLNRIEKNKIVQIVANERTTAAQLAILCPSTDESYAVTASSGRRVIAH